METPTPRLVRRGPFLLFLAAFFAVWAVRATVLFPLDAQVGPPLAQWAYAAAWKVGVWLVPAVAYAAIVDRRPAGEALGMTTRPTGGGVAVAAVLAGGLVAVAGGVLGGGASIGGLGASPAVYVAVAGAASVSVVCEEVLFRGLVLGELARRRSFGVANAGQAVLFAAAHWPNWLWTRGSGAHLVAETAWVVGLGLFFGWIVRRTGSLWPAVAAHLAVNTVLGVLYAP